MSARGVPAFGDARNEKPRSGRARVYSVVRAHRRHAALPQMQTPLKPNGELYGRMPEVLLAAITLPPLWGNGGRQ
jgi:hypothetical protein